MLNVTEQKIKNIQKSEKKAHFLTQLHVLYVVRMLTNVFLESCIPKSLIIIITYIKHLTVRRMTF